MLAAVKLCSSRIFLTKYAASASACSAESVPNSAVEKDLDGMYGAGLIMSHQNVEPHVSINEVA